MGPGQVCLPLRLGLGEDRPKRRPPSTSLVWNSGWGRPGGHALPTRLRDFWGIPACIVASLVVVRAPRRGPGHLRGNKGSPPLSSCFMLQPSQCIACMHLRGGEIENSCLRLDSPRTRLTTPGQGPHTILVRISLSGHVRHIQGLWADEGQGWAGSEGQEGHRQLGVSPAGSCRTRAYQLAWPWAGFLILLLSVAPSTRTRFAFSWGA